MMGCLLAREQRCPTESGHQPAPDCRGGLFAQMRHPSLDIFLAEQKNNGPNGETHAKPRHGMPFVMP